MERPERNLSCSASADKRLSGQDPARTGPGTGGAIEMLQTRAKIESGTRLPLPSPRWGEARKTQEGGGHSERDAFASDSAWRVVRASPGARAHAFRSMRKQRATTREASAPPLADEASRDASEEEDRVGSAASRGSRSTRA